MWDLDLYARLDLADAWAIIGPVNWYAPTTNLKLMFDRLVCMSGGNPREDLIQHKDPELAMALENKPEWRDLSQNHLEGRTAAFFCYRDDGGSEVDADGRPKILRNKSWFDPALEPFSAMRDAYAPLVWQSRYSGIEVPDELWTYAPTGVGIPYSENQADDMIEEHAFMRAFDDWVGRFTQFVESKGKVEPGTYRAFGYEAPSARLADVKLMVRDWRMRFGLAPAGSSPAEQHRLGLNEDASFSRSKSEGEKLRD